MGTQEGSQVLVVEDDPGDVMLIEEAFADRCPGVTWQVVGDGVDALAFLRKQPPTPTRRARTWSCWT